MKIPELNMLDSYDVDLKNEKNAKIVRDVLRSYVRRAISYKYWYLGLCITTMTLTSSVIVINQCEAIDNIVVTIIAAATSVITGVMSLIGLRESWFRYRKNAELLKMECNKYNAQVGEYKHEHNRDERFVLHFEKIYRGEISKWEQHVNDNNLPDQINKEMKNVNSSANSSTPL